MARLLCPRQMRSWSLSRASCSILLLHGWCCSNKWSLPWYVFGGLNLLVLDLLGHFYPIILPQQWNPVDNASHTLMRYSKSTQNLPTRSYASCRFCWRFDVSTFAHRYLYCNIYDDIHLYCNIYNTEAIWAVCIQYLLPNLRQCMKSL